LSGNATTIGTQELGYLSDKTELFAGNALEDKGLAAFLSVWSRTYGVIKKAPPVDLGICSGRRLMGSLASKKYEDQKDRGKGDCLKSVELEQQQPLLPQKHRCTSETNLN
jgi:hypothetical protein